MKSEKSKLIALERIADARKNKSFCLDLSALNLYELPDDISDLDHLIEINLSYNFFGRNATIYCKSIKFKGTEHIK